MTKKMDFTWLFDHFYIEKFQKIGRKNIPYHHHDSYELYYLVSGERTFFITGTNYHVKAGELVLIDRHDLHKAIDRARMKRTGFLISFKEDFLEPILQEEKRAELLSVFKKKVIRFTEMEQSKLELLLHKLEREAHAQEEQFGTYTRLLLGELFIVLGRKRSQMEEVVARKHDPKEGKIEEITAYIHKHYMKKLSLDVVANEFFISKFHLSRLFKEVTSFTFVEYVRSTRVLEAQKLLEHAEYNITDISERTGFDSPTHFGRVFKACTGITPLHYRKQFR